MRSTSVSSDLIHGILLLVTLAGGYYCFIPAASGSFLFDDFPNLENLAVLGGNLSWSSLGEYLAAWQGTPGRPLSALTFLIEDLDWPSDPYSFKRNNILWHLLTGVLIFGLCRKLSAVAGAPSEVTSKIALIVTAVWLVHPIHLSTTMLVVQRMTILSQALIAAGLWAYLVILTRPDKSLSNAIRASTILLVFAVFSYLAKENGPLIFVYATAINLTLARPILRQYPEVPRKILWLSSMGLTLALIAGLIWMVRDPVSSYASRDFTLWERLLTQPRVLLDYLQAIFLPDLKGSIYHDDFPVSRSLIDPISTLWSLILVIGTATVAVFIRTKYPLLAFAVLWFLAGHLIESTVIQLEIYFEHRNYLVMLGPFFAITMGLTRARLPSARIKAFAAIATVVLLAVMLLAASKTWGDSFDLAAAWAKESPNSVRAQQLLASEMVRVGAFDEAEMVLERASDRIPDASEFEFQRALLLCIAGTASQEDFEALSKVSQDANWARIIPDIIQALRGQLESDACEGSLNQDQLAEIIRTLIQNEDFSRMRSTKGHLFNELALLHLNQGLLEEALTYLNESFAARPTVQQALNRARVALELKKLEQAREAIVDARSIKSPLKSWLRQDERKIKSEISLYNRVVDQEIKNRYELDVTNSLD